MDFNLLLQRARSARENAYVPYAKFTVGAALLTASGDVFYGCNIENISFGLTLCAERAAAPAAAQAGQRQFTAIAIAADSASPIVPCGGCQQSLAEFNPSLPVYSMSRGGEQKECSLAQLLPLPTDSILDQAR